MASFDPNVPTTSLPYTCNTCLVAFRGSDAQRDHMRRDWHLYNMKRRVASLPPVSQETFNEKVLAAKATSSAAAAKASFEKTCVACQKTFYSENSYQNHVKSSKHRAREARLHKENAAESSSVMSSTFSLGEPINKPRAETDVSTITKDLDTATINEQEGENDENDEMDESPDNGEFSPARCLFCPTKSANLQENTDHMLKSHGMFIPEKDFLVNLEGLVHYLNRKITENNECLYCHAIKNSPAGVRTHMRDKGHCMIAFETEEEQIEIGQFYDFRSTYSDDEDDDAASTASDMVEDGGVKVDGEDDGWETETSASSIDEDDMPKNPTVIYKTEYEMHLPSGRSIGHRSLARYYRQNLHNYPTADERAARQLAIENGEIQEEQKPRGRNLNRAVISRGNGGSGMIGATESQKHVAVLSERKDRTRALRQEQRYTARVQRAANNQRHFRDPLLQ
ncbi:putative C2H2 finger domain protein [Aspergillus tanneri]|uniref:C2H2-type domain-containing protein n=1 Tax=Aspergillus tanneri TaxID=1220188 RepID=A0A5M9MB17_9EURO|nr:uncharacterized protein ATNIH1004_008454 [Aspergillus tanneri]KAA8644255.1 hypothetical protein ATNIH1004_008454 [Aspergillus tanneri]